MPQLKVENLYNTTITSVGGIPSSGDCDFTVAVAPTNSYGFIIISPENATRREIMYYHNVIGNRIYVRGENRASPKAHTVTESVKMNDVAEIFNTFSDMISQTFYIEKTGGLTVKVWGGYVYYNGAAVSVADTSLTLVDNTTNYITYTYATNTISSNTSNTGNIKATVVVASGIITSITYKNAKESYIDFTVALTGALPNQSGQAGKSLSTNGTVVSWQLPIPEQTGNAGKNLTTDGTTASWVLPGITGEIKIWSTNTAPTGWFISDGSAISRTTYASLFGVIGTTYGVGDGSTTFNLPNFKGRIPVGRDTSQIEFDVLGETGGEKTHVLTTPEMPGHTHTLAVAYGSSGGTGNDGAQGKYDTLTGGNFTTSSTGGGGAHNNLQPYITMNYIIKH